MKKVGSSSAKRKKKSFLPDSPDKISKNNEELFVTITAQNKKTLIPQFCKSLFKYNLSELRTEIQDEVYEYEAELEVLLNKFPTPFTIVQEFYHIDIVNIG